MYITLITMAASVLSAQNISPPPESNPAFLPIECVAVSETSVDNLLNRIAPADPEIVEIFGGTGASDISDHQLTPFEGALLREVLRELPQLHRGILQRHLRKLSFLDLEPGSGSALTRLVETDGGPAQFDITLKASLLGDSLSDFLNTKERRLFEEDGSGFVVSFDAGDADALTYILMHEASHMVDQVMGLTGGPENAFVRGIWEGNRELAHPFADSLAAQTPFRRQPAIPARYAPAYYESLRNSPFVSFYATAAAPEDLAELLAWQQLRARYDEHLTLKVSDRAGLTLFEYNPLEAAAVKARFSQVGALLERYENDCAGVGAVPLRRP